jgi:predicted  nucleic acid-binding Zn-ribbon protein
MIINAAFGFFLTSSIIWIIKIKKESIRYKKLAQYNLESAFATQQENKKLKIEIKSIKQEKDKFVKKIDLIVQEVEKLKNENTSLKIKCQK